MVTLQTKFPYLFVTKGCHIELRHTNRKDLYRLKKTHWSSKVYENEKKSRYIRERVPLPKE